MTIAGMANTYSALYSHVIFSTKNREVWLKPEIEARIWEVLGSIAREHRMTPIQIGGFDDHVHALVSLPPPLAISKAVQYLKGVSSKWTHETLPGFKASHGRMVMRRSRSAIATSAVADYICSQRIHHAKVGFQEEFRAALQKHGVEFDERSVWG